MTVHTKVAEALGMAIPEEDQPTDILSQNLVVVEPHEIVSVDNPELPDLTDVEKTRVEALKQLEELIVRGMVAVKDAFADVPDTEPKYRGRMLEVVSGLFGQVGDLVKFKNELALKTKKSRMEEMNFSKKKSGGGAEGGTAKSVTNFFVGNREELLKMYADTDPSKPS